MGRLFLLVALAILAFLVGCSGAREETIALDVLNDKIEGGWVGQMIGVTYGGPTEFRYLGQIIPAENLPSWNPDNVKAAIDQDDLYVEMTFAKVLDEKGLDATTEDFGEMFRDSRYRLWHANLAARRALKRNIPADKTGTPEYNAHANDIDFQIEADFIGLMSPGLPVASNELCWRVGRVMNSGDGIYGGMFVSGMYAAAFFEDDVRRVVESGLACLPSESPYAKLIEDVLAWSAENPDDWTRTWQLIQDKWDRRDPCPAGALRNFNIDAKINGAYIALGLLYGNREMGKTLEIATRAGQDSDCNPSNAAGILGTILGYEGIPDEWKSGIPAVAEERFSFTEFSLKGIVESTSKRAVAMVERNGGSLVGDLLRVRLQTPRPAVLQIWDDYGEPGERIAASDPRWVWNGPWRTETLAEGESERVIRIADEEGADASISFEGTGAIVVGPYLPDGGKANVYVDGSFRRALDVCSDEDDPKGAESIFHIFGLEPGQHTIRVEVLGKYGPGSKGSLVRIDDLVVFQ